MMSTCMWTNALDGMPKIPHDRWSKKLSADGKYSPQCVNQSHCDSRDQTQTQIDVRVWTRHLCVQLA